MSLLVVFKELMDSENDRYLANKNNTISARPGARTKDLIKTFTFALVQ